MTVVLGTDLSPQDEPRARFAARLARALGEPLRVVHVCEEARAPFVIGTDDDTLLGPARRALQEQVERLRAEAGIEVRPHLAAGSVAPAVAAAAELELATVLVVGAPGSGGFRPAGGTAEQAARASVVPVLALRDPEPLLAWLDGARPLRILVGADAGRAAQAARAFVARLAALGPTQVHVVQVVDPREAHARLGLPPPADPHRLSEAALQALLAALERAEPEGGPPATLRVLAGRGSADAHLVALTDQEDFDLVVVGQRRHSLLDRIWNGSVAGGVLRAAPASVACVPVPPEAGLPAWRAPQVVLAATDLGPAGDRALAAALGQVAEGGRVHLVHVLPPPWAEPEARRARDQAWYALGKATAARSSERAVAVERHVLEGAPGDRILALAERIGADLVVLGGRGRPASQARVLGSVALDVSAQARVPVLLVPRPAD